MEGFFAKTITIDSTTHQYVVYIPRGYKPGVPTPTILFLHGRGESGTDGWKTVGQGIGRAIIANAAAWPFIVVFPQKPDQAIHWEDYESLAIGTLEATQREYSTDQSRTYLTGLSQGGRGTWMIASRHPNRFAAIAPICGFTDPSVDKNALARSIAHLPIWCFHGDADDVIKPEQSRDMIAALNQHNAPNVKYTEYPKVNHNSWDQAYTEPQFVPWLLSHQIVK